MKPREWVWPCEKPARQPGPGRPSVSLLAGGRGMRGPTGLPCTPRPVSRLPRRTSRSPPVTPAVGAALGPVLLCGPLTAWTPHACPVSPASLGTAMSPPMLLCVCVGSPFPPQPPGRSSCLSCCSSWNCPPHAPPSQCPAAPQPRVPRQHWCPPAQSRNLAPSCWWSCLGSRGSGITGCGLLGPAPPTQHKVLMGQNSLPPCG